jgi:hypothetical protein
MVTVARTMSTFYRNHGYDCPYYVQYFIVTMVTTARTMSTIFIVTMVTTDRTMSTIVS